nr:uncharacterized protein LOC106026082 [Cavia porcellus]
MHLRTEPQQPLCVQSSPTPVSTWPDPQSPARRDLEERGGPRRPGTDTETGLGVPGPACPGPSLFIATAFRDARPALRNSCWAPARPRIERNPQLSPHSCPHRPPAVLCPPRPEGHPSRRPGPGHHGPSSCENQEHDAASGEKSLLHRPTEDQVSPRKLGAGPGCQAPASS